MYALLEEYAMLVPTVWLVLQVAALWIMRGGWRIAAWIPAGAMALALAVAALGVMDGSNLAPIWVVIALPVVLAWIMVLWVVRGIVWAFGY